VNFTTTVIRPEDHLVLELEFRDVDFTPPAAGQPGEIRGASGAFLIVYLQPQHIAEEAFYQASEQLAPPPGPGVPPEPPIPVEPAIQTPSHPGMVRSRLAGPSRLAFTVPAAEKIPYTLDGVLKALGRLPLSVNPVSAYNPELSGCLPLDLLQRFLRLPPPPHVQPPGETHTAIELPHRLILSPDDFGLWSHTAAPVSHDGWTELWHTRLGSRRAADPRVRAIWSPDFDPNRIQDAFGAGPPTEADPFRTSLEARDRNELVHLTSNHYLDNFIPTPVQTERFMLTTLGASIEVQGDWDPPKLPRGTSLSLTQWRHEAFYGRDQFVRVVRIGYLVPFGHRATLVKITERKFYAPEGSKGFVAYLFQRFFLIVKEPEKTFSHRSMPFRTVRIRTRVTPNLAPPENNDLENQGAKYFWPHVVRLPGGVEDPFLFDVVTTDWDGQRAEFATPLAFVDRSYHDSNAAKVVQAYNLDPVARRNPGLGGQGVAFAPPSKAGAGDTTLETKSVTWNVESGGSGVSFQPMIQQAAVDIPAVKQITAGSAPSIIEWEPTYLAGAGDAIGNAANLYAKVQGTPLDFGSTERAGGLVAPDLTIAGLSRSLGPIGGAASEMIGGNFDPKLIFGDDVKLLGGITLSEIIKILAFTDAANAGSKLPKLVREQFPDKVVATYVWELSSNELITTDLFTPKPSAVFSLTATAEKKVDVTTAPEFKVNGKLTDFKVRLLPTAELVELTFKSVSFTAEPGKKVDVSIQLEGIEFKGILAFVDRLQEFIPLDGFDDPPNLRIVTTPNPGVDLGFTLAIPTVGIGIMTMQNVSLGASVFLPFGDAPLNFRFAFCERHQPFTLTVSLFGGGGFFAMDVGIDKVVMVEAALEFGASVAINLGVAQGQASIMAGFYFQKAGEGFTLTGYFRASGSLSVIGIITVSLVFYLGLSYASKGAPAHPGALWGQASLTVKIEILFFSTSVSVAMEREFAGTDPTFRQLIPPSAWTEYCDAFAAYA
jgi:hypothetical protein